MDRRCALLLCSVVALWLVPVTSSAERGWVIDEVRVHKRTGPGTEFRILGAAKTGDSFEVLSKEEEWTQILDGDAKVWIPVGFLQPEPPARVRLERDEKQSGELRGNHERLTAEAEALRTANAELEARAAALDERVRSLERENIELNAGARWPEWIAGASILVVGGILGMVVHASTNRRQTRRIRL